MILSVDRPHSILQCDPSLPDLIDFSVDSAVGRTIRVMLGPKSETQMIDAAIKDALLMQSTKIPVHLYGQSGGEPRPVIVTSTPYQESGEMKGVRLVLEASCKEAIAVTQNIVEEKADQSNEERNSPKHPTTTPSPTRSGTASASHKTSTPSKAPESSAASAPSIIAAPAATSPQRAGQLSTASSSSSTPSSLRIRRARWSTASRRARGRSPTPCSCWAPTCCCGCRWERRRCRGTSAG